MHSITLEREQLSASPTSLAPSDRAAKASTVAHPGAMPPSPRNVDSCANCPPANTERLVRVTRDALPACCPPPGTRLWSSHPRIYLLPEIRDDASVSARCPYCSTQYVLDDGRRDGDI